MLTASKASRTWAIRLACGLATAAIGAGALAGDSPLTKEDKAPPKITTKVSGIVGPTSAQAALVKVASATTQSSDDSSQDQARTSERRETGGPARVKPGVGPGQGDGVHSIGPAPQ